MQLRKTRNLEFLRPNVQVPRGIRVFDRTRLVYTSNVSHICQLCLNRIYFIFSESLSKTLVKCHSEHMCIYFLEINCSGFPVPYQRDCYFMFFLQGVTFPCIFLWNIDNTTVFTSKQKRVEIELLLNTRWLVWKSTHIVDDWRRSRPNFHLQCENTILRKVLWFFLLYDSRAQHSTVMVRTWFKRLWFLWK